MEFCIFTNLARKWKQGIGHKSFTGQKTVNEFLPKGQKIIWVGNRWAFKSRKARMDQTIERNIVVANKHFY
jgi:hypothetical protein